MVVDELLKLLQSSPTKKFLDSNGYIKKGQNMELSKAEFDLWTNYVISVLNILHNYTSIAVIPIKTAEIIHTANAGTGKYLDRALSIEQSLLSLARQVASY